VASVCEIRDGLIERLCHVVWMKLGGKRASAVAVLLSALVCLGFGACTSSLVATWLTCENWRHLGGLPFLPRHLTVLSPVGPLGAAKILDSIVKPPVSLALLRNAFEHLFLESIHLTSRFGYYQQLYVVP